jgi:DNA-binding NtrC family response regulator
VQELPQSEAELEIEPELDRDRVQLVLQRVGGNKSAAARELGVSRRAFYRRLESLGLR